MSRAARRWARSRRFPSSCEGGSSIRPRRAPGAWQHFLRFWHVVSGPPATTSQAEAWQRPAESWSVVRAVDRRDHGAPCEAPGTGRSQRAVGGGGGRRRSPTPRRRPATPYEWPSTPVGAVRLTAKLLPEARTFFTSGSIVDRHGHRRACRQTPAVVVNRSRQVVRLYVGCG